MSEDTGLVPLTAEKAVNGVQLKPMDELRGIVTDFLQQSGENMDTALPKIQVFLDSISGDVALALEQGDIMSLGYLRDRIVIQLGRVSLGTLYRQREIIAQAFATAVRIFIRIGITALA